MPRKIRQLRADLRRAGWNVVRQAGSHQIWRHPLLQASEVNCYRPLKSTLQDKTDRTPISIRSVMCAMLFSKRGTRSGGSRE
jgi:predicted RNA binding protein YcfA (HicA-like mRNA interferase family)